MCIRDRLLQALIGREQKRAGMLQIFLCFLRNKTKAASHPAWIASKIQKYAPTLCAFLLDEQVDFRGALRLPVSYTHLDVYKRQPVWWKEYR